jgi:hypothetical protein
MSDPAWYAKWKASKSTDPKGPRVMNASEELEHLRKSPELRDRNHRGYSAAHARMTELYKEIYGDSVEEDTAR